MTYPLTQENITEDTILSFEQFIALDPELSLLHANALIGQDEDGIWHFRINPGDATESELFDSAEDAAYARYVHQARSYDRLGLGVFEPGWERDLGGDPEAEHPRKEGS